MYWLVFWIIAWLFHNPWRPRPDEKEPGPSNEPPFEYIKIPPIAQLLFGLLPNTQWLRLRAAIAQCLALLMAIINIVLKHRLELSHPRRLLELVGISLLTYHLLLFVLGLALDKLGPQPEQTEDRT